MSNGVNQCAACGGIYDDESPHVACPADCLHLAEMYVGQSSRDNEYGRRSSVIECLACGALRLDDETVPPNRLAGGDFDTSGQPRTLTADDPEPAVGSVVLDATGAAWQKVTRVLWARVDSETNRYWEWVIGFGPVTLIWNGDTDAPVR